MTSHSDPTDLESGTETTFSKVFAKRGPLLVEAGALLAIWSVFVINEGAIRLIGTNPSQGLLESGRPPVMLPFLGSLFEVFFGLFGLFLGIAAFVLKAHNSTVTKIAMVVQTILGYYVFAIFVFVIPVFNAVDLDAPSLEGLTLGESRFIIALGILTSFHFCLALQGGQFVFMARLVCAATGTDFLRQRTGAHMRAIFWNANLGLAGVWTLITGALVSAKVDGGKLAMPFVSPPNVGVLPGMTIATGILMIVVAAKGIFIVISRRPLPKFYFPVIALVYVFALLNFGIVQFGQLEKPGVPPSAGPVALHNGLVFMAVFLGPYFVHLAIKQEEENLSEAS